MATAVKVLGQVLPTLNTATTLYTVPADSSAVISTISICNTGDATEALVDVAVRIAGASLASKQYVLRKARVTSTDTLFLTIGITLGEGDVITVNSTAADVAFNAFGEEVAA